MLIRSQDKTKLLPIGKIKAREVQKTKVSYKQWNIIQDGFRVGSYSTKEKALKVLDMIHEQHNMIEWIKAMAVGMARGQLEVPSMTFEMPQGDEVD